MAYEILKSLYAGARELLVPSFCTCCMRMLSEDTVLCADCAGRIQAVIPHTLPISTTRSITVHAIGAYTEPLQSLIRAKAYSNRLAAVQLGQLMWHLLPPSLWQVDMLIPIPLHWTRFAHRGYNQSMVIAGYLSAKAQVPVFTGIKRNKRTPIQTGKNAQERQQNVFDAFACEYKHASDLLKGKKIVLIDDVLTTGATVQAVAKLLYKCGAAEVSAAVCARVI
jgi:ComF family protein